MSDPRFQDGSAGTTSRSARTSQSVIQQLFASLTSACLALDELDMEDMRGLRDSGEYITKMNRLMSPMFTSPASAARQMSFGRYQGADDPPTTALPGGSFRSTPNPIRRMRPDEPIPKLRLHEQCDIVSPSLLQECIFSFKGLARGYLVDKGWWDSWVKACAMSRDPLVTGTGIRFTMNPVDNTSLVDPLTGLLRKGLKVGDDLVVVNKAVWEMCFVQWYGKPSHVLTCDVRHSDSDGYSFDLYPNDAPNSVITGNSDWEIGSRWMLINHFISPDSFGYVVSISWWTQWRLHENGFPGFDNLGPIDNSDLIDDQGELKERLHAGAYVCVPLPAWHLLKTWFGSKTSDDLFLSLVSDDLV